MTTTTVRRRSGFFAYYDEQGQRREIPNNDLALRIVLVVAVALVFLFGMIPLGIFVASEMTPAVQTTPDSGVGGEMRATRFSRFMLGVGGILGWWAVLWATIAWYAWTGSLPSHAQVSPPLMATLIVGSLAASVVDLTLLLLIIGGGDPCAWMFRFFRYCFRAPRGK